MMSSQVPAMQRKDLDLVRNLATADDPDGAKADTHGMRRLLVLESMLGNVNSHFRVSC